MPPVEGEPPYRAVATPVDFDRTPADIGPVPSVGEHTAEVLGQLGYTDEEIAAIRAV
jgi:formyl-CoA transferase